MSGDTSKESTHKAVGAYPVVGEVRQPMEVVCTAAWDFRNLTIGPTGNRVHSQRYP